MDFRGPCNWLGKNIYDFFSLKFNWDLASFFKKNNECRQQRGRNAERTEVRERLLSFGAVSSSLLFKNLTVKMHRTIIYPVVLYGCETWPLTLREELRLKAYKNGVLRGYLGLRRTK